MAAARASLEEVLVPDSYRHLDALNDRLLAGCQAVLDRYGLPGYPIGVGAKGCVTFSPVPIVDYESYKENQDAELADLAWLYNMNRGIFMTPGAKRSGRSPSRTRSPTATPLRPSSRRWPPT